MIKFYINFQRSITITLCLFFVTTSLTSTASAVSSIDSTTVEPTTKQIHVLIAPGHEPNVGGTVFKGLKERDLTVALGTKLQKLLAQDSNFQVTMTRDTKDWNPIFTDYFKNNWTTITSWQKTAKKTFTDLVANGTIAKPISKIGHNNAPINVATRIYGINKWANENNIDIVITIHFDDENNHRFNIPGQYSGFVIYEPAPQYDNYQRSQEVAQAVFNRLNELGPISNLPGEKDGIIEEPQLIAVGENNTSKTSNLLIEYGFIYEKKFTDPKLRNQALDDLALKTYQALDDYRIEKQ